MNPETTAFFIRNQGNATATAARRISFDDSLRFERIHEQAYRDLGFQLVEVPAGPLDERVALIRQTVGLLTAGRATETVRFEPDTPRPRSDE
jgi:predicted ATPase